MWFIAQRWKHATEEFDAYQSRAAFDAVKQFNPCQLARLDLDRKWALLSEKQQQLIMDLIDELSA